MVGRTRSVYANDATTSAASAAAPSSMTVGVPQGSGGPHVNAPPTRRSLGEVGEHQCDLRMPAPARFPHGPDGSLEEHRRLHDEPYTISNNITRIHRHDPILVKTKKVKK